MGGRVKAGYCMIGGVTQIEVREFFDNLVKQGKFESRSKAICHVLTEYMKNNKIKEAEKHTETQKTDEKNLHSPPKNRSLLTPEEIRKILQAKDIEEEK
jgi:Arc/MetJ-type ribon-helix-helix transcriptional regulator